MLDVVYENNHKCIQKVTHTVLQWVCLCVAGAGHNFKWEVA